MKNLIIIEGKIYKVKRKDFNLADLMQNDCKEVKISFAHYIQLHYQPVQVQIPTIMF